MKTEIVYVEIETGGNHDGKAWIGKCFFSKSGKTIYFNGNVYQKGGRGGAGNHYDIDSGEGFWISGVKKNGTDRHKFGKGIIEIDESIIEIANKYFDLNTIPNLEIVIDDAFEFVLKTKETYDLIIIDIFQDTTMPNFLFQDFFINRVNSLLNVNGFILFNTMVINKKEEERNLIYKSKFGGNYSLRMYPKVEVHNELFTIKKLQ